MNQNFIIQNCILIAFSKRGKNRSLNGGLLIFNRRDFYDELVTHSFYLRFKVLHHIGKELVIKTIESDSEVDDGKFDADLW